MLITVPHCSLLRRLAVKLKRAVVEQRKQAEDTREKEAKLQARKVARRPHPLKALLEQKRAEFFVGLGTGDVSVPLVLQIDGRVYNRCGQSSGSGHVMMHPARG